MYLYFLNYPDQQQEICQLEMRRLFGLEAVDRVIVSPLAFVPGRSVYFKARMEIWFQGESLSALRPMYLEQFKVLYQKHEGDSLSYEMRLQAVRMVSQLLIGQAAIHDPQVLVGVTRIGTTWFVGRLEKDHQSWQAHIHKPQSYSQSLSSRDARTIVNIATRGQHRCQLIDPCCGVGTVVLEALALQHTITASDLHPGVCWKANRNLTAFGFNPLVQVRNLHEITGQYDVAILDIPYNLYSDITAAEQQAMLVSCRRFAKELILISYEPMALMLDQAGWQVHDHARLTKMKMQRFIYCCQIP